MILKRRTLFATILAILAVAGCSRIPRTPQAQAKSYEPPPKTLRPFKSEDELSQYLKRAAEKQQGRYRGEVGALGNAATSNSVAQPSSPAKEAQGAKDAKDDNESITNVQHAGVDEGGIVKLHGNYLVVLRRGRLFTVDIAGGGMRPVSVVDAFAPDIDPSGSWYDEMLISDDTIAVIGYSYQRGGTEVGLFSIDNAGNLQYRSTYHLRSNDYYSSRNYASRLIGNKLIFYTPLYIYPGSGDPFQNFPALRKWHKGATAGEFRRIYTPQRIFRADTDDQSEGDDTALHTVTVCTLGRGDMQCEATGVLGPAGRVFYVSPQSVYVWTTSWNNAANQTRANSMIYRMPLDGSSPTALGASGSPVDQFSFLEGEDGYLNVLVRSDGNGDGMWGAQNSSGDTALLRVPVASFTDGSDRAPRSGYNKLPRPDGYEFQNRYVGDYLLYGTGSGWGAPEANKRGAVFAKRVDGGEAVKLSLTHGVDRIESIGDDAIVVGTDGRDLHFTSVRLDDDPSVAFDYVRHGASQGELRSQGFFYKPDSPDSGTIGLPISEPGRAGYKHLFKESASILFLHNESLNFQELGNLVSHPERSNADQCRASCVDWYGNSRPIFAKGRTFALLGYEIVEGQIDDGRIRELRRVNYAPRRLEVTRR